MPDQIILTEGELSRIEKTYGTYDRVSASLMQWLSPIALLILICWSVVWWIDGVEDDLGVGLYVGVVMAWLISMTLLYLWRRRIHEALVVVGHVRDRGVLT